MTADKGSLIFALILVGIVGLFFAAAVVWSLVSLGILIVKTFTGTHYKITKKIPPNVLAATDQIKTDKSRLLEEMRLEIRERDELMSRYQKLLDDSTLQKTQSPIVK